MKMLFYVLASLTLTASVDASALGGSQPNIVFILTDDQGYGDISRHGHPLLKTPNLDALHDESVRFENFYVSPSCSPTRAALMTGLHEFKNGVTHTTEPRERLNPAARILPQLLKTAGYRTALIGKWHLGNAGEYAPDQRGFDWVSTNTGGPNEHFDPTFVINKKRMKRLGYREDLFFDDAMAFIDAEEEGPFFCYLATYSPHAPLDAPAEFIAPFRGQVTDEEAKFLGMVANLDYNVGRLMRHLREKKLDDNTIVIFMNDNGQTHGLDVFNANMRGCKCTIWQGGSRAMSFWRWSGKWQPHEVSNLTAHLDVLPTLCDLAGVPLPTDLAANLDGFTLRPLLESAEPAAWHDDRLLFHHVGRWPSGMAAAHKYAMASVQQGRFLLIRSHPCADPACKQFSSQCTTLRSVESGATRATYTQNNAPFHWGVTPQDHWALFDLEHDSDCMNDISRDQAELAARLATAYDQWWDALYPTMIELGGDQGEPNLLKTATSAAKE